MLTFEDAALMIGHLALYVAMAIAAVYTVVFACIGLFMAYMHFSDWWETSRREVNESIARSKRSAEMYAERLAATPNAMEPAVRNGFESASYWAAILIADLIGRQASDEDRHAIYMQLLKNWTPESRGAAVQVLLNTLDGTRSRLANIRDKIDPPLTPPVYMPAVGHQVPTIYPHPVPLVVMSSTPLLLQHIATATWQCPGCRQIGDYSTFSIGLDDAGKCPSCFSPVFVAAEEPDEENTESS